MTQQAAGAGDARGHDPSQGPPGLPLDRLGAYLAGRSPVLAEAPLTAERIVGGKSNLTYVVTGMRAGAPVTWVVRRPPLGHVLATAHDMAREFRVLAALAPTGVPVPEVQTLCADPEVIGAPFYLMEYVEGTVYRDRSQTADLTPRRARAISWALVDVLADLHAVDAAAVGLGDFGRPEGFLDRQVARWGKQLAASHSREVPGIDALHRALGDAMPKSQRAAIVHGDYRLDNAIVDAGDRIAAVVDWEMATLGDPLADLGLLCVYWSELPALGGDVLPSAVDSALGFPGQDELVERYAARSGLDLSALPWYVAFGYFKLAVIAEGIHYRFLQGQTVGSGFEGMGDLVPLLVRQGLDTLEARRA